MTPMPPRTEAPGAIPLVFAAEVAGLRELHDLTLLTAAGDEEGELEAVEQLRASGLDVHVVDRRRPTDGAARWRRRWRLAATWAREPQPWRTVWFADPAFQLELNRLTSLHAFDVLAVDDSSLGMLSRPATLPGVLTEHEVLRPRPVDWHCGRPGRWASWAFGELDRHRFPRYQASVWRRFDKVQVFTARDAETVAELAPDVADRVRINPFGILPSPAFDETREEPGRLLFVGNFTHPPNVEAARWLTKEIMPRLREKRAKAHLVVVGGAAPAEVYNLAGPDVTVLGEVAELRPHLETASVVVAPVRSGGGMRMKVLHALGAGKAVVTTSRGADGLSLAQREPPLLVADEPAAIATAVASLLADPDRRHALGRRARSYVEEQHSPEAWARRLEAVYLEAIEARRTKGRR